MYLDIVLYAHTHTIKPVFSLQILFSKSLNVAAKKSFEPITYKCNFRQVKIRNGDLCTGKSHLRLSSFPIFLGRAPTLRCAACFKLMRQQFFYEAAWCPQCHLAFYAPEVLIQLIVENCIHIIAKYHFVIPL